VLKTTGIYPGKIIIIIPILGRKKFPFSQNGNFQNGYLGKVKITAFENFIKKC
jgi:hypothetical protein